MFPNAVDKVCSKWEATGWIGAKPSSPGSLISSWFIPGTTASSQWHSPGHLSGLGPGHTRQEDSRQAEARALPARVFTIQREVSSAAFTMYPSPCPPLPPSPHRHPVPDSSRESEGSCWPVPWGIIVLVIRWPLAASSADSRLWAE